MAIAALYYTIVQRSEAPARKFTGILKILTTFFTDDKQDIARQEDNKFF